MNLPEAIALEIARVASLRERYKSLGSLPNVMTEPVIMMIDVSIKAAAKAIGSNDPELCLAALEDLKGFER